MVLYSVVVHDDDVIWNVCQDGGIYILLLGQWLYSLDRVLGQRKSIG